MRGEASSASHTALRLATKASRKELRVLTAAQRSGGEGSFFSTSTHSSGDSALASVAAGCEEDTTVAATAAVLLAVGGAMLGGDALLVSMAQRPMARAELASILVNIERRGFQRTSAARLKRTARDVKR